MFICKSVAAMKEESRIHEKGAEKRLLARLDKWAKKETNPEVRVMVEDALEHVREVVDTKATSKAISDSVPLSALRVQANSRIIRESFTVELPENGIHPSKVFAIRKKDENGGDALFICIPFEKSLTPAGNDIGGVLHPYTRIPIYVMPSN
eukprot:GEMP01025480.1.p1 GENE.GEMP01025480.1~~GEMP01025480.1.p1  ORF type:complete len:151 (+),score=32.22 GEMP01025480.1:602-1054(+)